MACGSLEFPADLGSTQMGKDVLASAIAAADATTAEAVRAEKKWRESYGEHFLNMVKLSSESPQTALNIARAGIQKVYEVLEFVAPNEERYNLREAITSRNVATDEPLHAVTVVGQAEHGQQAQVPYKGKVLEGARLLEQIDCWIRDGAIERCAGSAVEMVLRNESWVRLDKKDDVYVVMGAGAAMGPLQVLLSLGATVVAVDINVPAIWMRLIQLARQSAGKLIIPVSSSKFGSEMASNASHNDESIAAAAGCSLLDDGYIRVARWLTTLCKGRRMVLGAYAYVDGARFVKIVAAMDALMEHVRAARSSEVCYAYLCTPTDIHLRPESAWQDAEDRYKNRAWWHDSCRYASLGRYCNPPQCPPIATRANGTYYYANCVVAQQGPNYLLAKRIQHWRAMVARADGVIVSSNVAPASATHSVMKNKLLAAAYAGTDYFPPIEIFPPDTSNAVMTLMLIHDLNNTNSCAHPGTKLANPQNLFTEGAWHGGFWRLGFALDSVTELCALLHMWDQNKTTVRVVGGGAIGGILALLKRRHHVSSL
eukprot:m.132438 g.132438  ORF g.132438 m.132438 type:complete len:540 (-) comp17499_c0_seq3:400-2019(-)